MEQGLRILHLEDSAVDAELVERELRHARMAFAIKRVETRGDFVKAVDEFKPDLILLDYKLPAFDGLSALAITREECPDVPVIFVSGVIGEDRAIETLKSGATDYVLKDKLARLAPAIVRALRESEEIRERKRAEEAVRDSEERFRVVAESAGDAIICLESPDVINFWNKKAGEMFGYTADEAIGKAMHGLIVPERYREKACQGLKTFYQTGVGPLIGKATEICALRRDRSEFPAEITISAMQIKGKWTAVGIVRDITERKKNVQKLQEALNKTIEAISLMIEMRDPYTAGHEKHVARLACAIAKEIGFSEDQIEGIRVSAFLHDIGKIVVPSETLSKPAKLNEYEMGIVKTHALAGFDIVKSIEFPWPVSQAILQHHERLNGSGYPNGLKGEEIALDARILAVADVVEAMINHRPYRPALGIDKAMEEITQGRGVLYDAHVVDACVKLFTEKGFQFEIL